MNDKERELMKGLLRFKHYIVRKVDETEDPDLRKLAKLAEKTAQLAYELNIGGR